MERDRKRKYTLRALPIALLLAVVPFTPAGAHTGAAASPIWTVTTQPGPAKYWLDPLVTMTATDIVADIAYEGGCGTTNGLDNVAASPNSYEVNLWRRLYRSDGTVGSWSVSANLYLAAGGPCDPGGSGVYRSHNTASFVPLSNAAGAEVWVTKANCGNPESSCQLFYKAKSALQASVCASGAAYSNTAASWGSNTLAVYFDWVGSTSGWGTYGPDPGDPPYPASVMSIPGSPLEGFERKFGATSTVMTNPGAKLRVALNGSPLCYVVVNVAGGSGGPGAGTIVDETGTSCGVNIFCIIIAALRKVFLPTQASKTSIQTVWDELEGRLPFSLIFGLFALQNHFDTLNSGTTTTTACFGYATGTGPDAQACLGDANLPAGPVGAIRLALKIMLWVGFAFIVWRRMTAALGRKPDGGEDR